MSDAVEGRSTFRSGYCGSGTHDRCAVVAVNGAQAPTRYVMCACACHDGNPHALAAVLDIAGGWDVASPLDPSMDEMLRYLDTVNALVRPRQPEAV